MPAAKSANTAAGAPAREPGWSTRSRSTPPGSVAKSSWYSTEPGGQGAIVPSALAIWRVPGTTRRETYTVTRYGPGGNAHVSQLARKPARANCGPSAAAAAGLSWPGSA